MFQKKKAPLITLFIFAISFFSTVHSSVAEDKRIQEELKDTSPLVIPLKEALGAAEYEKSMKSGEYYYTGNLKCRLCHRDFFMGRKKDVHEHSFKKSIKREHMNEPRCLICHTTGYGVKTGFTSIKKTPKLANVQCEGCHGPGSKHNEMDSKGGFLAGTDRIPILKKMCAACHNSRWHKSYKDLETSYKKYKKSEAKAANGM